MFRNGNHNLAYSLRVPCDVQMPAVLCTCVFLLFGVGQARIEFPQAIGTARKMLEIDFQELPFPQSDIQHQVVSATQAHVDGTKYILECVAISLRYASGICTLLMAPIHCINYFHLHA